MIDAAETLERRAEALDRTAWAHGLSWGQILQVAQYCSLREASAGETIVAEGARDAFLGVVVDGQLEVVKQDSAGSPQVLTNLARGTSFGEMSLLDGEPRSASVLARIDTAFLTISAEDLELLVNEKPRLGVEVFRRLGRVASRHLRRTSGALVDSLGG